MIDKILGSAKAIVAFLGPVLTYIGTQIQSGEGINPAVAVAYLISALMVWAVPNGEKMP